MCRTSGSTSPRERRLTSRTEAHLANGGSPREQRLTSRTEAHLTNGVLLADGGFGQA
ncbi:hypothetical protein PGTUg99_033783 [Puccinia graminis f. sp. tritici]|uniref:Uncharacterized protein n=1 Tax=Puccinia graminis f. sp. tritici TaxID=56615 RepID=A0A5B0R962_PUCGR|nr:hypothetical protein PGTUg99_033783 [Puccinia graminis f. sp. tritici]